MKTSFTLRLIDRDRVEFTISAAVNSCDALHEGVEARVPYKAEYYFYGF